MENRFTHNSQIIAVLRKLLYKRGIAKETMSVIRKNLITNDWVIFAPNRLARPTELKAKEQDNIQILAARPENKTDCPFCPGNEKPEDKVVFTVGDAGKWRVRVIENKFSSVARDVAPNKRFTRFRKEIDGFGIHDVFIDNPRHNTNLALMSVGEIQTLVQAYHRRYLEVLQNELVKHAVIFKNQGIKAGGSLEHPHSQIYGLPVVPFEITVRMHEMERYFETNDNCLMCDIMRDEINDKERLIYENESFISFMSYADLSPYHFWIVPKHHCHTFAKVSEQELADLADCMKAVFARLYKSLKNPDYNFVFQSLTHHDEGAEYFHWYISVIPQIKTKGGISYAGGLYVNPVMPEDAAKVLRETAVEK